MKQLKTAGLIFLSLMISCGPSREEIANERLQEAEQLTREGNYNLAKLKLDTLLSQYKDQQKQAEQATRMLNRIILKEQQRNVNFLDSLLADEQKKLDPLMKNFIISDEYGSEKILIHKRQRPENSYNRTFIRAHPDLKGNFFISSRYHGTKWISHHQIKVYYGGKSAITESVPEDGFNNRRFEDGDFKWEIVNYKDGKDNGVIDFIAKNWQDPLRVQFIGKGYEYIIMEKFDREAIRDGYEISFILKDIARLKAEKKKALDTINHLKNN